MEIRIVEYKWSANILLTPQANGTSGFWHCQARVLGHSLEEARNGAQHILDIFAAGRIAFVRVPPEASTEKDFRTKTEQHVGYVRFSFGLKAGTWTYQHDTIPIPEIGAAI